MINRVALPYRGYTSIEHLFNMSSIKKSHELTLIFVHALGKEEPIGRIIYRSRETEGVNTIQDPPPARHKGS